MASTNSQSRAADCATRKQIAADAAVRAFRQGLGAEYEQDFSRAIRHPQRSRNQRFVKLTIGKSRLILDPKQALAFLSSHAAKLKDEKNAQEAHLLATMEAAHYKLLTGDTEGCKTAIQSCEKILDSLNGLVPVSQTGS